MHLRTFPMQSVLDHSRRRAQPRPTGGFGAALEDQVMRCPGRENRAMLRRSKVHP